MKVLFISTSVPPAAESQTIRSAYLLRSLVQAGHDVRVVAPNTRGGDPTLLMLLPPNLQIERTDTPKYDRIQAMLTRAGNRYISAFARRAVAVAAGKILVPDVRADWSELAYRAARKHASRCDVLVSSSGSYTANIAASRIAGEFRLPWVADYGDPWTINPLPPASHWYVRQRNERLERRTLRLCSTMTVTTRETAEATRNWLGWNLPIETVPCGYDEQDFVDQSPTLPAALRIAYVGTITQSGRSLLPLLDALSQLRLGFPEIYKKLLVEIVGPAPLAFEQYAARLGLDRVRFTGPVSYRASCQIIGGSDVLYLIGNKGHLQIPLKAFMYLGSGRPILYVGQVHATADPTWAILRSFGGVVYSDQTADSVCDALRKLLSRISILRREAAARRSDDRLQEYTWSSIGARFCRIVEEVSNGKRRFHSVHEHQQ